MKESEWLDIEDIRARVAQLMPGEEEKVMSPALKRIIEEERPKIVAEERPKILDEGRADILIRQLRRRFGELPDGTVDRVRAATTSELEQMVDSIVTAETLQDVLAATPVQ